MLLFNRGCSVGKVKSREFLMNINASKAHIIKCKVEHCFKIEKLKYCYEQHIINTFQKFNKFIIFK